jgi:predicted Zn-dependent protease
VVFQHTFHFSTHGSEETINDILNHDTTVSEFKRAVELEPDDPWLRRELARELLATRKIDRAVVQLRKAIELDPKSRNASMSYDLLGDLLARQSKQSEALDSYREACAIRKRLTRSDPGNTGWQQDLSACRQSRAH